MSYNYADYADKCGRAIQSGLNKAHDHVLLATSAIVLMQIANDGNLTAKGMRDAVNTAADAAGFEAFRKLYSAANAVYRDRGEVFANFLARQNARSFEDDLKTVHGLMWKPKNDKNASDNRFTTVDSIRAWVKANKDAPEVPTDGEVMEGLLNAVHKALNKVQEPLVEAAKVDDAPYRVLFTSEAMANLLDRVQRMVALNTTLSVTQIDLTGLDVSEPIAIAAPLDAAIAA